MVFRGLLAHGNFRANMTMMNTTSRTTTDATSFDRTFTHHTIEIGDVSLHYVAGGAGEPLVLLHGCPQTWYEWRGVMPGLAKYYTVIAPDLRGLGDSSKPATGYDKRTAAEDIYGLLQQLGHNQINLVGHDIGMMVAYAFAAAYPGSVRRLAVMEGPLPGIGAWDEALANPKLWHFHFHMAPDVPEALVAGRERMYLEMFYRRDAYDKAAITRADVDEFVRCYSQPGALRAFFNYYRVFPTDAEHNKEAARKKLQMPVLALGGAASLGTQVEQTMRGVAEDVGGRVVERSGHWIAHERPEQLTDELLRFFDETEQAKASASSVVTCGQE